jgi:hypothetical protein
MASQNRLLTSNAIVCTSVRVSSIGGGGEGGGSGGGGENGDGGGGDGGGRGGGAIFLNSSMQTPGDVLSEGVT